MKSGFKRDVTQKGVLPKLEPELNPVAQKWCYPNLNLIRTKEVDG